jgi:hypothetical protein
MTTVAWDDGSDVERRQHGMVMGWDDDHPPPASRATARGVDRGWSYKEAPQPSDHDSTPYRYYEPLLMGWKGVLCEKYGGRLHNAPTPHNLPPHWRVRWWPSFFLVPNFVNR